MSDEMEPREIREYRVWDESGGYIAGAKVTYGYVTGMYWVTSEPFTTTEESTETDFQTTYGAFEHARELADRYMQEAIADATERFGEPPVGVLSEHGYSIQICEDGMDITAHV